MTSDSTTEMTARPPGESLSPDSADSRSTGPTAGIGRSVMIGARWMSISQIGVQVSRIGTSVVLAHLLDPKAFGLVAMATVVTAFVEIFRGFGTGMAIIQRSEVNQRLLSSVFYFNLVLGVVCTGLLALASPLVSDLYGDQSLTAVLRLLALIFLFDAIGDVQMSLLRRELRFAIVSVINFIMSVVTAGVSIGLASVGFGVQSLVIGTLAGVCVRSAMAWRLASWRPSAEFRASDVRSILRFSANLSGFNFFNYFLLNADKFLVGRFLGATPLGIYGMAQRVLMYPVSAIGGVIGEVSFPGLARVQHDNVATRRAYLRLCSAVALVCLPAMAGAAVVASDLVPVVLGDEWRPLIKLVWILAPIGGLQSVTFTAGMLYTAKGRTDIMMWWGLGSGLVVIAAYIIGLQWGLYGMATGYAIAIVALTYPGFAIPFRLIDLKMKQFLSTVGPHFLVVGAMAGAVALLRFVLVHLGVGRVDRLVVCVVAGAAVYAGLVWAARLEGVNEMWDFIGRRARLSREGAK